MRMGRLEVDLQWYRGSMTWEFFLTVRADIYLLKALGAERRNKKYSPQKYHSTCAQVYLSEETCYSEPIIAR